MDQFSKKISTLSFVNLRTITFGQNSLFQKVSRSLSSMVKRSDKQMGGQSCVFYRMGGQSFVYYMIEQSYVYYY